MMTVGCFARSLADIRLCFSLMVGADARRPDVPELLKPSLKGYFETLTERDRFITQFDLERVRHATTTGI